MRKIAVGVAGVASVAVVMVALVVTGYRLLSDEAEVVPAAEPPPTTGAAAPAPPGAAAPPPAADAAFTLLAAGDIAACGSRGDEATAAILDAHPRAAVATLGDNVYPNGTPEEFERCYAPSWGRHRARTRPAPGNHDYATPGAGGYFGYFGSAAGDPRLGHYSYDLAGWHVVVLNSNCAPVGCGRGSAQERWLRADLGAHAGRPCTLAYWRHPRFSSGSQHGSAAAMGPLYGILYEHGVDVVLAGHEHVYERFAPLDPDGRVDPGRGVRSFVVGTGGRSLYGFDDPLPGSEARNASTFGVLGLQLEADGYRWRFLPVAGGTFGDSGVGACH